MMRIEELQQLRKDDLIRAYINLETKYDKIRDLYRALGDMYENACYRADSYREAYDELTNALDTLQRYSK